MLTLSLILLFTRILTDIIQLQIGQRAHSFYATVTMALPTFIKDTGMSLCLFLITGCSQSQLCGKAANLSTNTVCQVS